MKLEKLAKFIVEIFEGQCILYVQRSFLEQKISELASMSLHYDGRSIDMRLIKSSKNTGKYNCEESQKKLAYMAVKLARFTYVAFKQRSQDSFVHASCQL